MRWLRRLGVVAAGLILFVSHARGQEAVHRVGVLASTEVSQNREALLDGLREHGYVPGQNLRIEYRCSQARNEQIPTLAAEIAAFGPKVTANPVTEQVGPHCKRQDGNGARHRGPVLHPG